MKIYPDSRAKRPTNVQIHLGFNWVPIFSANYGADGGFVPEENCTFAFYLCDPCAHKMGPIHGSDMEPDAVFFDRVRNEQLEKYGRELSLPELAEAVKDEHSSLTKLTKDRDWRGE
jgi:hypothetical protein